MKRLCLALAFLSVCLLSLSAHAYKRTKSPAGKVLFWSGNDIPFHINKIVPDGLDPTQVYAQIRESFQTWATPSCTCLRFLDGGITDSRQLGYDQQNPQTNQNIILFQSSQWTHPQQAVAITSNIFNEDTGEVVAYDMELNDVHFTFSLDGRPRNGKSTMDLRNVVTHEVGHVIGLDHSDERQSTMYTSGLPGETKKRDLHQDDLDALCLIYPTNGCQTISKPLNSDMGCGCHQSSTNAPSLLALLFIALLGLILLIIPRRQTQ